MDKEYINKITLQYLLNPNIVVNKPNDNTNLDKEIKFYRKRIYQITKDMSKGNYLNDNLKNAFENYISEIIYFLKQQDLEDIYQKEYIDIIDNSSSHFDSNDISFNIYNDLSYNVDKLLTIPTKDNKSNLNNFIKKINITTEEPTNLIPKKKQVNIRDPSLRTKGVKKNLKE